MEKVMRTVFTALLLGIAAATAMSQSPVNRQAGDAKPPFTLEITANLDKDQVYVWDFVNNAQTVVKAGSKVNVARRKTNITDHEIKKRSEAADGGEVRDSSGNLVKPKVHGTVGTAGGGPTTLIGKRDSVLEPGESKVYCDCYGGGYDFEEPGTYTIQIWEHVSDDPKSDIVKSNIIHVVVLPADAPPPAPLENGPGDADGRKQDGNAASAVHAAQSNAPSGSLKTVRTAPASTFSLAIKEDKDASRTDPSLHRILVGFTRTAMGVELEQFHRESENMYDMTVLRDGVPAAETVALRELRDYRKIDFYPTIQNPRALKPDETWIDHLDVSDYFEMTQPGAYQVTVTRKSPPYETPRFLTAFSVVKSNTITMVVPKSAGQTNAPPPTKPKPGFSLTIAPSNEEQWPGPPVLIRAQMDNTGDTPIRERKCAPFMGMYRLHLLRNGDPLPENEQMRILEKSRAAVDCPNNEILNEIKPGGSDTEEIPVSSFFDVYTPGSYVVYVTRETYPWNPAKSVTVESNSLSFVVP